MVSLPLCEVHIPVRRDSSCYVYCDVCDQVLFDDEFTEEPTFVKCDGGEIRRSGVIVKSIQSTHSDSFRRTLDKGVAEMRHIVLILQLDESIEVPASRFYEIAVQRNFTRGRRTVQVAAACLYIACWTTQRPKPFLLIEFSETLKINVYVLGSVFLQLCQLLSLQEHNIIKKPVDPTLFVPWFTQKLLATSNAEVSRTAMHIIASMKRDWMQTGRKPSGLCGAALYISALAHGFTYSKSDIVKIVHICEVTLTKRLIEFENTESGSFTIEELENNAKELKNCKLSSFGSTKSKEVLCQHKEETPFANGLCRNCFQDFIDISGGLDGSDPPAFQQAEKIRVAKECAEKSDESEVEFKFRNKEKANSNFSSKMNPLAKPTNARPKRTEQPSQSFVDESAASGDESDGLSDIDDVEVNGYLNDEVETRLKKIIWEEMNKEYLLEQAAKKAAGYNISKPKPKKERRQKQDPNDTPPQTAAEAARQMLSKKRFSSKINYDALERCFAEDTAPRKQTKVSNDEEGQSPSGQHLKSDVIKNEDEVDEEYEEDMEEDGFEFDQGMDGRDGQQLEDDGSEFGYSDDEF